MSGDAITGAERDAPRRGRPRAPGADGAILDAALRLLAREGYARMTVEAVAAEAGVGKATVYLRWGSKGDLATAALAHLRESGDPPRTGDVREDVAAVLETMRRNSDRLSAMSIVGTCLAEERHIPELIALLRERTLGPRRATLRELLREGVARGEIGAELDVETAVDLLMGAHTARHLAGEPFTEGWADRVVRAVLGQAAEADGS